MDTRNISTSSFAESGFGATGSFVNTFFGPGFLAEKDVSNYLANPSGASPELKAAMKGFMTNDPIYNG